VPEQLLIVDAAISKDSLMFIFYGMIVILPMLIAYTAVVYRVFYGKTTQLSYH
jgi:cytochrome d ubiquinol oxidase subunit II